MTVVSCQLSVDSSLLEVPVVGSERSSCCRAKLSGEQRTEPVASAVARTPASRRRRGCGRREGRHQLRTYRSCDSARQHPPHLNRPRQPRLSQEQTHPCETVSSSQSAPPGPGGGSERSSCCSAKLSGRATNRTGRVSYGKNAGTQSTTRRRSPRRETSVAHLPFL